MTNIRDNGLAESSSCHIVRRVTPRQAAAGSNQPDGSRQKIPNLRVAHVEFTESRPIRAGLACGYRRDLSSPIAPMARDTSTWVMATPRSDASDFVAVEYQRQTIYHLPQTPGYTCWVGA